MSGQLQLLDNKGIVSLVKIFQNEKLRTKNGIQKFSDYIDSLPDSLGVDPFPLFHSFAGGIYHREIHMPAGYIVIGKKHKHDCMVYMLKGKVLVCDTEGVRVVTGPARFKSSGGLKRVGYVIEPVVWVDIHRTDANTVEEAEQELLEDKYSDYELMIEEMGYSLEDVQSQTENVTDMIDYVCDNCVVKKSDIDGYGLFSTNDIEQGDTIGIARIGFDRTYLGRYANHSFKPNTKCSVKNNSIYYHAIDTIKQDEEITVDYKDAKNAAAELDGYLQNKQKMVGYYAKKGRLIL